MNLINNPEHISIHQNHKHSGVTILELLLVIGVMSVITLLAVRYYEAANTSNLLNQAVDQINAVKAAVGNYVNDSPGYHTGEGLPPISDLVSDGYLPQSFGDGTQANPWGGSIMLNCGSTGPTSTFSLCMDSIPNQNLCNSVDNRIAGTLNPAVNESVSCTASASSNSSESYKLTVNYLL